LKKSETEKRADRHIRITDTTLTEQIDKIMQYPEFKSFSKVINEALYIALPQMIDKLEGREEITLPEEKEEHGKDEKFYGQVVRLMREIIMNSVINKAILSSLFEVKRMELKHQPVSATALERGCFQDLPQFAEDYEVRTLRKIRDDTY